MDVNEELWDDGRGWVAVRREEDERGEEERTPDRKAWIGGRDGRGELNSWERKETIDTTIELLSFSLASPEIRSERID
jgi:hypothetical protein